MKNKKSLLDYHYGIRITHRSLNKYKLACGKLNRDHSDVTRELLAAFSEGRVTIEPTSSQKKLYNP